MDRDPAQPVEEVLAEQARGDLGREVLVRRRDEADVERARLERAEPEDGPLLEDAEELRLDRERHVADLVEEDGAARRLLEEPELHLVGPGEGALLVPEELALEERLRERGAVDSEEGLLAARGARVDRVRDDLLPGPRLAEDEHVHVRLGDARHEGVDPLHRLGPHDDGPSLDLEVGVAHGGLRHDDLGRARGVGGRGGVALALEDEHDLADPDRVRGPDDDDLARSELAVVDARAVRAPEVLELHGLPVHVDEDMAPRDRGMRHEDLDVGSATDAHLASLGEGVGVEHRLVHDHEAVPALQERVREVEVGRTLGLVALVEDVARQAHTSRMAISVSRCNSFDRRVAS